MEIAWVDQRAQLSLRVRDDVGRRASHGLLQMAVSPEQSAPSP